jgi:hypothetical protein
MRAPRTKRYAQQTPAGRKWFHPWNRQSRLRVMLRTRLFIPRALISHKTACVLKASDRDVHVRIIASL